MLKQNKKIFKGFIFFIFHLSFFILCACTSPIDIKTDNSEPVIVINGTLTDEYKQQEIQISKSAPYFDNHSNEGISGAVVTIKSSSNEIYELKENDTIPGLYQTIRNWAALPGATYHLNVKVDFNQDGAQEMYDAETTIIPYAGLDSIQMTSVDIMGYAHFSLDLYGQDPPEHNYYLFKYIVNDTLITTKVSKYRTFDDVAFNGQYLNGLTLEYFNSIETWDKYSEKERKDMDFLRSGDRMTLHTSLIPKGYHDFINQCQKEMQGENPFFGGPASNIITNISNGAIGYFSGYCITKNSANVP